MKHAAFTLVIAVPLCAAAAASAAEREQPKASQEVVVADAKDAIERAERNQSVEELKAVFRKRLTVISRWSQLR